MKYNRRQFMGTTLSTALAASASSQLFAAPALWIKQQTSAVPDKHTLVIIYLRGGADALNAIIPYRDENYYTMRPTIAVPSPLDRARPADLAAAIPLDKYFAFHPALAPLVELYKSGHVAPIVSVGSGHETRSHFDAQDFMEWAAPGIKSIQEGWLNRYLERTRSSEDHFLRAFSPQSLLPRSLRGRYSVLAAPGEGSSDALDAFADLYQPCDDLRDLEAQRRKEEEEALAKLSPLEQRRRKKEIRRELEKSGRPPVTAEHVGPMIHNAGVNTVKKLKHLNGILAAARKAKKKKHYPRGPLGSQLSDIATVIQANQPLEISALDYGGWDHHSREGGSSGQMAGMLRHLAESIAAFVKDLGPARMERVTVLTMTEFGRTAAENGTLGTDHGHGGFMLAVGGGVNGGKVHGKWAGLHSRALYRGRDLAVTTDFRDVFAELLLKLYKYDPRENDFFPGYERVLKKPLGVFGTA